VIDFGAERVVAASPSAVWTLVSDPTRFPEWFDRRPPGRVARRLAAVLEPPK
jgi:uncharacterized protein YndB with AHSA1/START domain